MATLADLHRALSKAIAEGGGTRVYFYVSSDRNDARLRHGHVNVIDSLTCQLQFEGLDQERALGEIPRLDFIKVDTLAAGGTSLFDSGRATLDTRHVLNLLDPALLARARATAAQPATPVAAPSPAAVITSVPTDVPPPVLAPEDRLKAVRLINVQLKDMAAKEMEPFFGTSTLAKIEDIARRYPPFDQPERFLRACEQEIAMFVGTDKAAQVFTPLYRKLKEG